MLGQSRDVELWWWSGLLQFELGSVLGGKTDGMPCTLWWYKDRASSRAFIYACNAPLKVVNLQRSSVFRNTNSKSKSSASFDRKRLSIWFVYVHSPSLPVLGGSARMCQRRCEHGRVDWTLRRVVVTGSNGLREICWYLRSESWASVRLPRNFRWIVLAHKQPWALVRLI